MCVVCVCGGSKSFSPSQIFSVVADVDRYKEFLPWCKDSIVLQRRGTRIVADLIVGFQLFEERYTSAIVLVPNKSVNVRKKETLARAL